MPFLRVTNIALYESSKKVLQWTCAMFYVSTNIRSSANAVKDPPKSEPETLLTEDRSESTTMTKSTATGPTITTATTITTTVTTRLPS